MFRKLACAVAVLALSFGIAAAEELRGRITKIEGNKLTFAAFNKETKKLEDAKTYDVGADVKVSKRDKKEKVSVTGGLKAEELSKIGEKGIGATINVNDGKVSEIILGGRKKKE